MTLEDMKNAVFAKKPIFKAILDKHSTKSLHEYYTLTTPFHTRIATVRTEELARLVEELLEQTLDKTTAREVRQQLMEDQFVSIADHHGPITHPFFSNSALVQGLVNKENNRKHTIVFSFGSISFDNSSFPRGFLLHDANLADVRLHLVPLKHKSTPVYGFPPYSEKMFAHVLHRLDRTNFSDSKKHHVATLLKKIYLTPETNGLTSYSDQMTRTNYHLWKDITDESLIYLELETIVARLLTQFHIGKGTVIDKILQDGKNVRLFVELFDGILGAYNQETKKGTVLFWSLIDGKREQLMYIDGKFETTDGTISFKVSEIPTLLDQKKLIPNMALCFIIVSLYYGIECAGGFTQVNTSTWTKEKYIELLKQLGFDDEVDICKEIVTDIFRGDIVCASLSDGVRTVPATPLDLSLYQTLDTKRELEILAKTLTLGTATDAMIPELYKIVTRQKDGATIVAGAIPPLLYV